MSTFICTKCGSIENTATSDYWYYVMEKKQPICSYCSEGKWHNRFERIHWSKVGINKLLEMQSRNQGDVINAKEYLIGIGEIKA